MDTKQSIANIENMAKYIVDAEFAVSQAQHIFYEKIRREGRKEGYPNPFYLLNAATLLCRIGSMPEVVKLLEAEYNK